MKHPARNALAALIGLALLATATATACSSPEPPEPAPAPQRPHAQEKSPGQLTPEIRETIRKEVARQLAAALQEEQREDRVEEPGPEPETAAPVNPELGICSRSPQARTTITEKLGMESCKDVTPDDLYTIQELQITIQALEPQDLAEMYNLAELQVDGLEKEIPSRAFRDLHNLQKLQVFTNEPAQGEARRTLLPPGAFNGLEKLKALSVTSDQGWATFKLDQRTLSGLQQLESIRMDFISNIQAGAFNTTPGLRKIDLHGVNRDGEFVQRIPRDMFKNLPELEQVTLHNFRWPPLIHLDNQEVACAARNWKARSAQNNSGSTPLSITIGADTRPRDLESMSECRN